MKSVTLTYSSVGIFAALAFTAAATSRAQEPRRLISADSIPRDLAAALIASGGFGADPQILIGSMPEWIGNRLSIPSGARVLGSAFLGTTVVAVVAMPLASDTMMNQLKSDLMRHGWTNPPPQPSYGGGFRPAPAGMTIDRPLTRLTLCRDQQTLIAYASRQRGTVTDITYRVSTEAGGYSVCRPPQLPAGMTRSPFPTLYTPPTTPDARMSGDCASNYGGSTTSATLQTSMTPEALLDHFARQLQDSGWTSSTDKASIIGRTWSRTDSSGTPVQAVITVMTPPQNPACRELNLQVRTMQKP
jgi:hypothetical protein